MAKIAATATRSQNVTGKRIALIQRAFPPDVGQDVGDGHGCCQQKSDRGKTQIIHVSYFAIRVTGPIMPAGSERKLTMSCG